MRQTIAVLVLISFISFPAHAAEKVRTIHVLVALCDNQYQGIVPVPKNIGNGANPDTNLYWGIPGGVRYTFFQDNQWRLIRTIPRPRPYVLERCIFRNREENLLLIADAYQGQFIRETLTDFFKALSGRAIQGQQIQIPEAGELSVGSASSLLVYLGHNGLMDFSLAPYPTSTHSGPRDCIVLCCRSEQYFSTLLQYYGARPVLLVRQLMYPGAMVLESAVAGWSKGESLDQIRRRVAAAYAGNQGISIKSALSVFTQPRN